VFAIVRDKLAARNQVAENLDGERFNLRKVKELEVRKQYQNEITNRFAALEKQGDGEDINGVLENIKENTWPVQKVSDLWQGKIHLHAWRSETLIPFEVVSL